MFFYLPNKSEAVKKLTLAFVFIVSFTAVHAQFLRQPVVNFTPSEYGQEYSSYTLAVVEDDDGIIYIGTAFGVLQYDGSSWRYILVKPSAYVTSLAVHQNTVYVGSQGEFGYLKANNLGKLEYQSLTEKLHEQDKDFSRVWKTLVWNQSVVFQASEKIFLYENDSLTVIDPIYSFHYAFVEGNNLYVRERDSGLMLFNGKEFELVKKGELFADLGIFAILPFNDQRLIVTLEKGLWLWRGNEFVRINKGKDFEKRLADAGVVGAVHLSDGNYALQTLKKGILILDKNLDIVTEYSENSGMLSSEIVDLIQDRHGNLWSATQRGATRLLYPSAFSYHNQSSGLFGIVQAVGKLNESLLVGTSVGLFTNHSVGMKAFDEVSATKGSGSVWSIEQTSQGLWIGAEFGVWFFDGKNYYPVSQQQASSLRYIPEFGWMVSSGVNGLQIFDTAERKLILKLNEIKGDVYGLAYELDKKKQKCEIWLGTKSNGVWQLIVSKDLTYTFDYYFGSDDGLSVEWVSPYQAGDKVVFASSEGMYKFVSPETIYQLLNDNSVDINDLRGYFDYGHFPKDTYQKSVTAFSYDPKETYAAIDYYVYAVSMSDSIPSNRNFKTLQLGRFNTIKKYGDLLFVGGDGGLAIVDQTKFEKWRSTAPNLLLRKVVMGIDSTIWFGDMPVGDRFIQIPYSQNSLSIDISSDYYENGFGAQYSWMLNGIDKGFTRWSPQGKIQLTNLREGNYELQIVARNIHDELGNVITLNFSVLPPWYRTFWAYAIYAILGAMAVFVIIQLNIRRLKAQNRKLEEIVKLRTKEVVEQKERIEHILEDIRSSISYAQRIQQALLPSREFLNEHLPNHFILFLPRDVVSGDFYWAGRVNNWLVVTVVDCTGHGVPGAFMSMLGISFLHEIVRKHEETNAANILNELRKAVIEALKQTGKQNEQKDGMDMSLIAIDLNTMKCQWAGANNSLYLVRKNGSGEGVKISLDEKRYKEFTYENCVLHEVKADKMPVAIHAVMDSYTNHEIDLLPGDRLYMFTDGFADQFGGNDCRKFMAKHFKELIAKTSFFPIKQQAQEMEKAFNAWKCSGDSVYEQIDDVTVMGIEV